MPLVSLFHPGFPWAAVMCMDTPQTSPGLLVIPICHSLFLVLLECPKPLENHHNHHVKFSFGFCARHLHRFVSHCESKLLTRMHCTTKSYREISWPTKFKVINTPLRMNSTQVLGRKVLWHNMWSRAVKKKLNRHIYTYTHRLPSFLALKCTNFSYCYIVNNSNLLTTGHNSPFLCYINYELFAWNIYC